MGKREAKMSVAQQNIYVKYLQENTILRTGKLTPGMDPGVLDDVYKKMTLELNCCGTGPKKTSENWKKSLGEWKCHVKKRARENKELKDVEKSLLESLGLIIITGIQGISELGFVINVNEENKESEETNAAAQAVPSELEDDTEKTLDDIPEVVVPTSSIQVEETEKNVPSKRTKPKKGNKSQSDDLLSAYLEKEGENISGLQSIASALLTIASAINRIADAMEKNN